MSISKYKNTTTKTSSPAEILILLYEKCIKSMKLALITSDTYQRSQYILNSMEIIQELNNSLDKSKNPELVDNLNKIYIHSYNQLSESNRNRLNNEGVKNALELIEKLYTDWKKVLK